MNNDTKLQAMIQQEARKIAEQVYKEQATKYGVSSTPLHRHNGYDSPRINSWDLVPSQSASGNVTMAHTGRFNIGLNNAKGVVSFQPSQIRFNGIAVFSVATFTVSTASATAGAVYRVSGTTGTNGTTNVFFTVTTTLSGGTTLVTGGAGALIANSGTLTLVSGTGDSHITYSSVSSPITIRALVVGDVFLGPSFYLQPQSSDSVVVGGTPQVVIQSSSCLIINDSGTGGVTLAEAGEGHVVDVAFPNLATPVARATIPDLGDFGANEKPILNGNLAVDVVLATGWWIQGNWVII